MPPDDRRIRDGQYGPLARRLFLFLLALCSFAFCAAAFARPGNAQAPRTTIQWPAGCAHYAVSDAQDDYRYERACAKALSDFKDWPAPATNTSACYDYAVDFVIDPEGIGLPAPKFLPFGRGKFLIEMDCGGGAYNPANFYLLYDETQLPATIKRLQFPYRSFSSDGGISGLLPGDGGAIDPIPPLITTETISSRAYHPKRRELIALNKFRGMGDCGVFIRYRFVADQPVIHEMRVKRLCDGKRSYFVPSNDPPSPQGWQLIPND